MTDEIEIALNAPESEIHPALSKSVMEVDDTHECVGPANFVDNLLVPAFKLLTRPAFGGHLVVEDE